MINAEVSVLDFIIRIISFLLSLLMPLGIINSPYADYTPLENRSHGDYEQLEVEPDASKYISIKAADTGKDIFQLTEGISYGYRYGPSLITNADGSIDAWFAAPGGKGEWDWIMYRHSPDGGETWTDETAVLAPTPDSPDFYSCCDPGVIKVGDYYYLGYTSTVHPDGIINDVFVARSRKPEGPYEKWNGNGWGGKPEPIVKYDGDPKTFGAGEPSFVLLNDKLYVYYTWRDGAVNQTKVAVADATDENWPATMEYKGVAVTYKDGACDSADVKYVEDFGKFVAVNTVDRFSEESSVGVYVSDDGISFMPSYSLKTNISHCCHNCGISSRENGHIRLEDDVFLAYAYGDKWGFWPTRMHKVELSLIDSPDFSDYQNTNVKTEAEFLPMSYYVDYVGITTDPHEYVCSVSDKAFKVEVFKFDSLLSFQKIFTGVKLSGYDPEVISVNGMRIKPVGTGQTFVTAEWNGFSVNFVVTVTE